MLPSAKWSNKKLANIHFDFLFVGASCTTYKYVALGRFWLGVSTYLSFGIWAFLPWELAGIKMKVDQACVAWEEKTSHQRVRAVGEEHTDWGIPEAFSSP